MGITETVKEWLWKVMFKKVVVRIATAIVAYAIAHGLNFTGNVAGIPIDISNVDAMTAALFVAFDQVKDFLKIKFPKVFGWL